MSTQKGFVPVLVVIGILILIGIAGGVYYFGNSTSKPKSGIGTFIADEETLRQKLAQPTSESTASADILAWKTYTNNAGGYSFQYSESLNIKENSPADAEVLLDNYRLLAILYYDNPDNLSLEQLDKKLTRKTDAYGDVSPGLSKATEQITIGDGIAGYYQKESFCEPTYCQRYVIAYKDKVYEINYSSGANNYRESTVKSFVDQILSTFKFLP